MPGISSLLKGAAATRQKIQNQQYAYAAFDWENSAQTYEDYIQYSNYLDNASKKTNDPSQLLTFATKSRSARRSYVSNELQRQQMAIMEGRATTQDMMNAVKDLYYQAVDNGDMNLAQNLLSQWDTLSVKAQNEVQAATKAYAAAGDKAFKNLINSLEKGTGDVTLPTGQKVTPLADIADYFSQTGDSVASMKSAEETMSALTNVIVDAYQNATSQDQIDTLESKYGPGLRDLQDKLTIKIGGKNLGVQDVINANANEKMNNPIYSLQAVHNDVTGQNEYKLKTNNVERLDYARQIDENGNEYYTPVTVRTTQDNLFFGGSDQGRGLDTQLTNNGFVIGGNEAKQGKQPKGKHVIILGGGDTGADCLGTAIRQGAASITQIEIMPRPTDERPATQPWPTYPMIYRVSSAHEEAGERMYSIATQEFITDEDGNLTGLKVIETKFENGKFESIEGSEKVIPADMVLLAMGFVGPEQNKLVKDLELKLDARGNIDRDGTFATNVEKVFVCGDAGRGQSLIVWAIAEGRSAAAAVDEYLMGHTQLPSPITPDARPLVV